MRGRQETSGSVKDIKKTELSNLFYKCEIQ